MSLVRTFIVSLFVLLSFVLVTPSQAQTCDPYHTQIRIDHVHYHPPNGETLELFFARLDQGTPVAERPPYVWRYDSGGWYWSCTLPLPEPTPVDDPWSSATLEVGKYYRDPYNRVAKVIGIVSPVLNPKPHWLLEYVTPTGGRCGDLGYVALDDRTIGRWEVPAQDPPAGCPWISGPVVMTDGGTR